MLKARVLRKTKAGYPTSLKATREKPRFQTEKLDTSKDEFHLVVEARDKATKSVQKYPLTLVRSVTYSQQQTTPPPSQPQK